MWHKNKVKGVESVGKSMVIMKKKKTNKLDSFVNQHVYNPAQESLELLQRESFHQKRVDHHTLDYNESIDLRRFKNKSYMSLTGTIYTPTSGNNHGEKKSLFKLKNTHSASKKDQNKLNVTSTIAIENTATNNNNENSFHIKPSKSLKALHKARAPKEFRFVSLGLETTTQ